MMVKVLGAMVVIVVSVVMHGWVISILWGWFVVPRFDVSDLTLIQALGLTLVVTSMTYNPRVAEKEYDFMVHLGMGLILPFAYLGLGFLYRTLGA